MSLHIKRKNRSTLISLTVRAVCVCTCMHSLDVEKVIRRLTCYTAENLFIHHHFSLSLSLAVSSLERVREVNSEPVVKK